MIQRLCLTLLLALSLCQFAFPAGAGSGTSQVALGPTQPLPQTLFSARPRLFTPAQTRKLMCSSTVACPQGYYCCPGFSSVSLCCPNGKVCNYAKFRCD